MGYLFLFFILSMHYVISYSVCLHFCKKHDEDLSIVSIVLITFLSGPLTLIATLFVIFVTPLRNTDAGLLDGGGTLLALLSLIIFPFVSDFLVRKAIKIKYQRAVEAQRELQDTWEA